MKIEDLNFPRKERKFINIGGCAHHFADVNKNSNGRNYSINIELEDHRLDLRKKRFMECMILYRFQDKLFAVIQ
jgi:hypothetical protein